MTDETKNVKEAWNQFEDFQHVFLATMEGNQPRVRPVTLIFFEKKFWITTDTWSAKAKQIRKNPKVEFSMIFKEGNNDCCIRAAGRAEIVRNRETKATLAKHCGFFAKHWRSITDPSYTVLKINPAEITIVKPDKTTHMKT